MGDEECALVKLDVRELAGDDQRASDDEADDEAGEDARNSLQPEVRC